jgi:hypothetical protein
MILRRNIIMYLSNLKKQIMFRIDKKVEDISIKIPLPVFVKVLKLVTFSYCLIYNSTKNK